MRIHFLSYAFLFFVVSPVFAECQLSMEQKQQIADATQAHKEAVDQIVAEMLDQPEPAKEQACLDNLMGINLDVFAVNPANIYAGLFDQLMDQIMAMACQAVEDGWNDAASALEADYQLPYDLGGVSLTASSGGWGNQQSDSLKMPDADASTWAGNVDIGQADTTAPNAAVMNGQLLAPVWGQNSSTINDDMQQTFIDSFF